MQQVQQAQQAPAPRQAPGHGLGSGVGMQSAPRVSPRRAVLPPGEQGLAAAVAAAADAGEETENLDVFRCPISLARACAMHLHS